MHSNNDISESSLSFFKWNFNKQKVWLREADVQLALAGPAVVTNVTFLCLFVCLDDFIQGLVWEELLHCDCS